jgi:hypothetical protein
MDHHLLEVADHIHLADLVAVGNRHRSRMRRVAGNLQAAVGSLDPEGGHPGIRVVVGFLLFSR